LSKEPYATYIEPFFSVMQLNQALNALKHNMCI